MRTNIIVTVKNDLYNVEKKVYLKVYSSLDNETVRSILQTSPYKRIGIPKHIRGSRAKSGVYLGFKNAPSMTLEEAVKYLNTAKFTEEVTTKKYTPKVSTRHVERHRLPVGIRITEVKHFWDKTFITFASDIPNLKLDEFWYPKLEDWRRVSNPDYPTSFFIEGKYIFEENKVGEHSYVYDIFKETICMVSEEYTLTVDLK